MDNRADFRRRFGAWVNDLLIILSLTGFCIYGGVYLEFISFDKFNPFADNYDFMADKMSAILPLVVFFIISFLYFVLLEGSAIKGTFGKRASGICVVDKDGDNISLNRSTFRYILSLLNWLSLGLGFLLVFLSKRRGIHDYICSTFVVVVSRSRFWFLHIFIWLFLVGSFLLVSIYGDKLVREVMILPVNLPVIPSYASYDNAFGQTINVKNEQEKNIKNWDISPDYVDFGAVIIKAEPASNESLNDEGHGIYVSVNIIDMPYLNNNSLDIFYISDKQGNIHTEFLYDSVIGFSSFDDMNFGRTPVIKLPAKISSENISVIEGKFNLRIPKKIEEIVFDKLEFFVSESDDFYNVEILIDKLSGKLKEFNLTDNDLIDKDRIIEFRAYNKKNEIFDRSFSPLIDGGKDINVMFPVLPEKIVLYFVTEYEDKEYPFVFGSKKP